jgi:hypothetical protein
VDASGFDFSKPYEPAASAVAAPAPASLPLRGHARRPTAALLGGMSTVSKNKK